MNIVLINKTLKNFPKFIKWIISTIVVAIISYLIIQFLRDENYSIIKENFFNILTLIGIFIGIGIFLAMYNTMKEQEAVINDSRFSNPKKNLKQMIDKFELETIKKNNYEWTFTVGRYFWHYETPEKNKFIDAIEMSNTKCLLCKSDIQRNVSLGFPNREIGAKCPNRECELHENLNLEYELKDLEQQEKIKFISAVRKNFDKYWKTYCDEYNRITKGKYDQFVDPIIQMWQKL